MKSYTRKQTKYPRKKLILVALVVLLAAIGVYAYMRNDRQANTQMPSDGNADETINYTPPTEEEKQETEDNKQRIVEEQEQQNNSNSGSLRTVSVTITSASTDSIFARVSGVVEDGGTCTATFTKGGTALSKSSDSIANVSDTQCGRIVPPSLASGTWQVVVTYKSNSAQGTSEPATLTIP